MFSLQIHELEQARAFVEAVFKASHMRCPLDIGSWIIVDDFISEIGIRR